ncbi:MAG: alpha amylase C-terminal domain-containing protein, partial [Alphaproteobacteria bacterium]
LNQPSVILTAEDHTGWDAITQPQETGGIGFDASWWAAWYHNLIGASRNDMGDARLLHTAGLGGDGPLAMSVMAEKILATPQRVIYSESHDEAGNAYYYDGDQRVESARTIEVAVNGFLNEETRPWAEARCRVTFGLTVLTPGAPMFFMGEEVGAKEPYRYNDWLQHREDIISLRKGSGAHLFAFYRDIIRLRRHNKALKSPYAAIVHVHDANRVIAFRRWLGNTEFLVVASLNNAAFSDGYRLENSALPDGDWIEALNSDDEEYGGHGVRNPGVLTSSGGVIDVRLPAAGIVVLQRI